MSLKSALAGGGIVAVLAAAALTFIATDATDPNLIERVNDAVSSPAALDCPDGWTKTQGTEPETDSPVVSCTDGRIILTKREGQPSVAFDTQTSQFVPAEPFLR